MILLGLLFLVIGGALLFLANMLLWYYDNAKETNRIWKRIKKEEKIIDPAVREIAAVYIRGLSNNQPNRDAIRRLETNWEDE